MHDEGFVPGNRLHAVAVVQITFVIGRLVELEIGSIGAGPLFLFSVPPDQGFALAPGLPVRARRRAVIKNARVFRPRKSPAMAIEPLWLALVGFVLTSVWHDAAVDPAAARGRAVVLQRLKVFDQLAIMPCVSVNLSYNFFDVWFRVLAMRGVIP